MSKPELISADEHLASCSDCREMLASREDLRAQIDSLRADLDKSLEEEHVHYAQLEAYVDQELGTTERAPLDVHFQVCESCSEELRDLQAFKNHLAEQGALGDAMNSRSGERRPQEIPSFAFPGGWRTGSRWALAACALIVLAIGIRLLWLWQRKPATIVHKPETVQAPIPQPSKPPAVVHRPEPHSEGIVARVEASQHLELPEGFADLAVRRGVDQGPSPLVSPVGTVVASTTPMFLWKAIPGADGYIVQVSDSMQNPVESSPVLNETRWMSTAVLKRGTTYVWRIDIISGGVAVQEPALDVPRAYFKVLDAAQKRELQDFKRAHPQEHMALGIMLAHAGVLEEAANEFSAVPPSDLNYSLAKKFEQEVQKLITGR